MKQNITAWFPLLLSSKKVFLDEEKLTLHEGGEFKEVSFKDIKKIVIRPLGWLYFLYKTNDLVLLTYSEKDLKLYNITTSGTDILIKKTRNINPSLIVDKLTIETEFLIIGWIRTLDASNGTRVPSFLVFIILVIVTPILIYLFMMFGAI